MEAVNPRIATVRESWDAGDGFIAFGPDHADYLKTLSVVDEAKQLQSDLSNHGISGLMDAGANDDGRVVKGLPIEFFNHDLMEVDASDDGSVAGFARAWGLPFHPARFGFWPSIVKFREVADAMRETDAIAEAHSGAEWETLYLSMSEARLSISHLQSAVADLRRLVKGDAWDDDREYVTLFNCANRDERALAVPVPIEFGPIKHEMFLDHGAWIELDDWGFQRATYTLTNAICAQVVETVANPAPWQVCEYCGKPFKLQRDYSPRKAKTDRKQTQRKYCCNRCAQAMKDVRRGKRRPPEWWDDEKTRSVLAKLDNPAR